MPRLRASPILKTDQGEIHPQPTSQSIYDAGITRTRASKSYTYPIISYHIISFHFQPKTPVHSIRGQRQLHHWGLLGQDIQINDTDPRQQTVISYHVLDPLNRTSESLEYCPTAPHAPPTSNNNLLKR